MRYLLTLLFIATLMAVNAQDRNASFENGRRYTYGFVNIEDSSRSIAPAYCAAGAFSAGLAAVKKDGKWGFIDTGNNEVIAFRFDYARSFIGGQSIVQLDEFYGVIDRQGEFVIPPLYYDLMPYEWQGKRYYISRDSTFFQGIIDTTGKVVLPHRYTFVIAMESNLGNKKLYKNIPFYTTYREIDTAKGSFYEQFSESAYQFSPQKGRQDIYDAQFNKLTSRNVSSYEDLFNGEELSRIDAWLEEHKTSDIDRKRASVRDLLETPETGEVATGKPKTDRLNTAGPAGKNIPASEEELNRYLTEMGYKKFSGDSGKTGVQGNGKTILPAEFDVVRWWGAALFPPPGTDLAYLKEHFAGTNNDGEVSAFLIFGIAAGSKEKGMLYSMKGEEIIDLTGRVPEQITPDGFTYRTVERDTARKRTLHRFGFVDWKGRNVLPPEYTRIRIVAGNRLMTKREKETRQGTEEHFGLYSISGKAIVPEGVFSSIEAIREFPNLFLAEWADASPTLAEQKDRGSKNKRFVVLKAENDAYSVISEFTASLAGPYADPESGMLRYRKNVAE